MRLRPNVTAREEFLPWSGYESKLITKVAARQLADVMVTSAVSFSHFAKHAYLNFQSSKRTIFPGRISRPGP